MEYDFVESRKQNRFDYKTCGGSRNQKQEFLSLSLSRMFCGNTLPGSVFFFVVVPNLSLCSAEFSERGLTHPHHIKKRESTSSSDTITRHGEAMNVSSGGVVYLWIVLDHGVVMICTGFSSSECAQRK